MNATWFAGWTSYCDSLVQHGNVGGENGAAFDESLANEMLLAFVEFALGDTSHWDILANAPAPEGFLKAYYDFSTDIPEYALNSESVILGGPAVHILHMRWAAVHLAVELAGWYPWSLADLTSSQLKVLTNWYEYFEPRNINTLDSNLPDNNGTLPINEAMALVEPPFLSYADKFKSLVGMTGLEHEARCPYVKLCTGGSSWAGPTEWLYRIPRLLGNPAAAARFARDELFAQVGATCPGWGESSQWTVENKGQACEVLVNWFHGPQNRYDTCDAVTCSKEVPGNAGCCPSTGKQAWIHLFRGPGSGHEEQFDYWRNVLKLTGPQWPFSFNMMKKLKVAGCHGAARFFVAAASGMNIPAVFGTNVSAQHKNGWTLSRSHDALEVVGYGALEHGDDLWGPGASLFPASNLFFPAEVALGPSRAWKQLLGQGLYVTRSPKPSSDTSDTLWAELLLMSRTTQYRVSRNYYLSFFDSALTPDYIQTAMDAFFYRVIPQAIDDQGWGHAPVFAVLKGWMNKSFCPAAEPEDQMPKYLADEAVEKLKLHWQTDQAGELVVPNSIWEEPMVQNSLTVLRTMLKLDEYAEQNHLLIEPTEYFP